MILSAHQPNYLPYPGLFAKINYSDKFIYLSCVQFEKQSWQCRNRIINDVYLTIPLKKNKLKTNINQIKIDNSKNWKSKHYKSIFYSYKKSKFFNDYINFFEDIYNQEWKYLNDLNIKIMNFLLKELEIDVLIYYDTDFNFDSHKTDKLIEMSKKLDCNEYISNIGSQAYININQFKMI